MVEQRGNAPRATILQGSSALLCLPHGAQSRFRAALSEASARRFHQISLLSEIGADTGSRTPAASVAHSPTAVIFHPHCWCLVSGNDPRQLKALVLQTRSVLSCIPRHVGRGCRSRTGYRQVMSLAWLSVPLTRYWLRGLNSLACAAYIRPAQNCMEDGGGVEPLTRRCHGFQDRCPPTQASPSVFLIAHDLRANAFPR